MGGSNSVLQGNGQGGLFGTGGDGYDEFGGTAVGKAVASADYEATSTVGRGLRAIGRAIFRS